MKLFQVVLVVAAVCVACSSSEPENMKKRYPNLTELNPPGTQQYTESNVYVDSVSFIDWPDQKGLLISGNLANGCTKLREVNHTIRDDSLHISLTGWKPSGKMCTQALVPFSYMYDQIPGSQIKQPINLTVNGTRYNIKQ